MRKLYENPEMEILKFEAEDVFTTSGNFGLTDEGTGSGDTGAFKDLFPNLQ